MPTKKQSSPESLPPIDPEDGTLNVIVETPKGSRNKFKFDEAHGLYKLGGVLPAGMSFPYDFGFIPSTKGEDGDPVDVLLLMDEPAFPGCLVSARLIGVIARFATLGPETVSRSTHSFLGKLSGPEWGRMMYKHLDHHLRQFGT